MSPCLPNCDHNKELSDVFGAMIKEGEREVYTLQKDVDYFGSKIPKGAKYKQQENLDWYTPTYNGCICPSEALHFTIVKNNPLFKKD